MDARFYNSEEIDIGRLASDLENMYRMQGYEVQQIGNKDQMMVQLKKGSDLIALLGLQAALSVILQRTGGGTIAMIGQQRWIDKAAVGAVGLVAAPVLWPLMITAGAGAIRQASLGNQVLNVVDGLVRQQYPSVQVQYKSCLRFNNSGHRHHMPQRRSMCRRRHNTCQRRRMLLLHKLYQQASYAARTAIHPMSKGTRSAAAAVVH